MSNSRSRVKILFKNPRSAIVLYQKGLIRLLDEMFRSKFPW